jgi:hypothetical protein
MLLSTRTARTLPVEQLVKQWAELYKTDLSAIFASRDPSLFTALIDASSPQGRTLTAARLNETLLNSKCQFAVMQAQSLYEYLPQVLDMEEANQLTQVAFQVYTQLLELYQKSPSAIALSLDELRAMASGSPYLTWGIEEIEELAAALGPVLLKLQARYTATKDWRTLGFMTTQLNFCNKLILQRLSLVEQILLRPYFKFVEEQVAVPWHRVCAAATKHQLYSPAFMLVEKLLPASPEIAIVVYQKLNQLFPKHQSRRGNLTNPDIAHSCLRDLSMFQAYLWLCLLQGSLEPIEQELVVLCVMVMESVEVKWEFTAQWIQLLTDEILSRADFKQKALLSPYTEGMKQIFYANRARLGANL